MDRAEKNIKNKLNKKGIESKSVSDRILFAAIIVLLVALTLFLIITLTWGLLVGVRHKLYAQ